MLGISSPKATAPTPGICTRHARTLIAAPRPILRAEHTHKHELAATPPLKSSLQPINDPLTCAVHRGWLHQLACDVVRVHRVNHVDVLQVRRALERSLADGSAGSGVPRIADHEDWHAHLLGIHT
eukprot:CAMPEP_0119381796 /NCGR_PEP_ID=MMETSP1334-20130426/67281_1 /TAXON_ID=127549 /ORGANISM="Calcidiscus leptoporus, Strain RCC1130" /LENGTH=124 /DNA_ID=CAMNT_0007402033 /DNA_START=140 /DNA_END=514 /DNA_ORIENTATION=+